MIKKDDELRICKEILESEIKEHTFWVSHATNVGVALLSSSISMVALEVSLLVLLWSSILDIDLGQFNGAKIIIKGALTVFLLASVVYSSLQAPKAQPSLKLSQNFSKKVELLFALQRDLISGRIEKPTKELIEKKIAEIKADTSQTK